MPSKEGIFLAVALINSMKLFVTGALILFFCKCVSDDKVQPHKIHTQKAAEAVKNIEGCYLMTIGNDSAFMQLGKKGDSMKGTLTYKPYEKDRRRGKISLLQDSHYLTGWYYFESEGMFSVQQVRFRITDAGLEEGYGKVKQRSDTVFFEYSLNILKFESQHPFKKITCP